MSDCIFCKIASNMIVTTKIFEDGDILAFNDINPQAPVHVLIVPKKHISSLNDIGDTDSDLLGKMAITAKNIAIKSGVDKSGFRLIINCNKDAGQAVPHLHMHMLGGRPMNWPPG